MIRAGAITAAVAAVLSVFPGCRENSGGFERVEWTVMGTVAAVQTRGCPSPDVRDVAKVAFSRIEKLLNAHDPVSEISSLSGLDDNTVLSQSDPHVRACYAEAFRFRDVSCGAFDPRWKGDGSLDLGAIAKGFALDEAARELASSIPPPGEILLDLGGCIKSARGEWKVAVYGSGRVVALKEGAAIATSGEMFRGAHIIDARTGECAKPRIRSVSVVHPSSATDADALSTILFILGEEAGGAFLEKYYPQAEAIWVR